MNLNNQSSGDWDVLAKNTNMIIGDVSEDYGWDLTLFFGEFTPAVVEEAVGKRKEVIDIDLIRVAADVLHFKYSLGLPKSQTTSMKKSLGIPMTGESFKLEYALGVNHISEIVLNQSLSFTRTGDDVKVVIPLGVVHVHEFPFNMSIGKTIEKSMKKLKRFKKFLESL